jgi:hypothetical protein
MSSKTKKSFNKKKYNNKKISNKKKNFNKKISNKKKKKTFNKKIFNKKKTFNKKRNQIKAGFNLFGKKTRPQGAFKPESKPESKPEPEPQSKPEPEPEPESKPEPEPEKSDIGYNLSNYEPYINYNLEKTCADYANTAFNYISKKKGDNINRNMNTLDNYDYEDNNYIDVINNWFNKNREDHIFTKCKAMGHVFNLEILNNYCYLYHGWVKKFSAGQWLRVKNPLTDKEKNPLTNPDIINARNNFGKKLEIDTFKNALLEDLKEYRESNGRVVSQFAGCEYPTGRNAAAEGTNDPKLFEVTDIIYIK